MPSIQRTPTPQWQGCHDRPPSPAEAMDDPTIRYWTNIIPPPAAPPVRPAASPDETGSTGGGGCGGCRCRDERHVRASLGRAHGCGAPGDATGDGFCAWCRLYHKPPWTWERKG